MKYAIEITEMAKSDLRDIMFYIADLSKEKETAKNFVRELLSKCKILDEFPLTGAVPKDRTLLSSGYRYLVYKEYHIFYCLDDIKGIAYITAVFNAKKDYTRVMKKI